MRIVPTLEGEFELDDTFMRAILGSDMNWKPGGDEDYLYHFAAENELLGVAANPYESPDFSFELPHTPIIDRAHLSFYIAGSPHVEAMHAVIQCVGRALQATDADLYFKTSIHDIALVRYASEVVLLRSFHHPHPWSAENLAVIPKPYKLAFEPSFNANDSIYVAGDFELTEEIAHAAMPDPRKWKSDPDYPETPPEFRYERRDGLLSARGRQLGERYELPPAHELPGAPIRERVSVSFDFENSENLERARFEALKCALRVIAVAKGDLLVRYRDLILMSRRGSELTLYHTLPENDFWDRPEHLELVPKPYRWARLDPPWHVGRPKLVKQIEQAASWS
ncbi:MAG: hypothetical protein AAFZ38_12780 [Myxococcota bacterium]